MTLRATRDIHGRQITDGHFQVKLNRTDLLSSRLYWRSASKSEIRDAVVNGLVNMLATCESFLDHWSGLSVNEWNDKRSSLIPIATNIAKRLSDSLHRESVLFRSEFHQMAAEWIEMYQQNDLYLQDIVSAVRQVALLAQPYLERTTKNIQAISRALIEEGTAFYQAATSTLSSLYQSTTWIYQKVSGYVSSTATEAARFSSKMAGELVNRLMQLESCVVNSFRYLQSVYYRYSGQLEAIVMEKVEDIRRQVMELANTYAKNFQPYLDYFETWVQRSRIYFDTVSRTIQGLFKNHYWVTITALQCIFLFRLATNDFR